MAKAKQPIHYPLGRLINKIKEPNRTACRKFLAENEKVLSEARGSSHNHQNWPGGYLDHMTEVMNMVYHLYTLCNRIRPLPFSLSSALVVAFLHDIEKPWKYVHVGDGLYDHSHKFQTKDDDNNFRLAKADEYGFELTALHVNGIKYAEGELGDYTPKHRMMSELGAMVHAADILSARMWFAYPLMVNDPWKGAGRLQMSGDLAR